MQQATTGQLATGGSCRLDIDGHASLSNNNNNNNSSCTNETKRKKSGFLYIFLKSKCPVFCSSTRGQRWLALAKVVAGFLLLPVS